MKKMLSLLLVVCLALWLAACGEGTAAAQTLRNQKKEVILYTTQINYNEDGTEFSRVVVDRRYDDEGNLVGMDNYDGRGSRWEYVYNAEGVQVSQLFYDPQGQLQNTQYYDQDGNVTRAEGTGYRIYADGTEETYATATVYTYDDKGRLQERITTDDGVESLHETYTYDDAAYTGIREVVSTDIRGNVDRWTDELTYNEAWQILTSHRSPEGGHSPMDEAYTYDEEGRETSYRCTGGSEIEETTTYDENGNLLYVSSTSGGTLNYEVVSTIGTLKEALERQETLDAASSAS